MERRRIFGPGDDEIFRAVELRRFSGGNLLHFGDLLLGALERSHARVISDLRRGDGGTKRYAKRQKMPVKASSANTK